MFAVGFGLVVFSYTLFYYGVALATGQHRNLLYCMFHTGDPGALNTPSSANGGSFTPSRVSNAGSYIAGQCTAFVASLFPWVPSGWGNAFQWLGNASQAGFETGNTPNVGAVAVWGSGLPGSGGDGHVAAVTSVYPDGSFDVEEMNYSCGPFCQDSRHVPAGGGADFAGFIYPNQQHGGTSFTQ